MANPTIRCAVRAYVISPRCNKFAPELEDIDKCEDDANESSTVPLLSNPAAAHWQGRYLDITVQKQRVGRLLLDATSDHARVKR